MIHGRYNAHTDGDLLSRTKREVCTGSVNTLKSHIISSNTAEVSSRAWWGASLALLITRTRELSQTRGGGMKSIMCSNTPCGMVIILIHRESTVLAKRTSIHTMQQILLHHRHRPGPAFGVGKPRLIRTVRGGHIRPTITGCRKDGGRRKLIQRHLHIRVQL